MSRQNTLPMTLCLFPKIAGLLHLLSSRYPVGVGNTC